jgi:hypothetical protein
MSHFPLPPPNRSKTASFAGLLRLFRLSFRDLKSTNIEHEMQHSNPPEVDWTGVRPDESPIAPLDAHSFTARLRLLSERASSLTVLRNAFAQQQAHADRFSRDSEQASR